MERLQEILALLADADALAALTPDELAALDAELVELGEQLAADPTPDNLTALDQIAEATDTVRAEAERRETEAAEAEARAADALARIRGEQTPDDGGEGGEGEGEEGEGGETPAETPPAETPAEGEGEGDAADQLAAGAAPVRPRLGRVAARRPAAMTPTSTPHRAPDPAEWGLVASANLAGFTAGERLNDPDKLARAFAQAIESTRGYRHGPRVKVPVARSGGDLHELYGEDRILDSNAGANMRKIRGVTDLSAITAAGGICAPIATRYDLPVVGDDDRPVRDGALARFGADRGGVSTIPPPILTDLDAAIGIWTEANDQNPADPATKPCLTVTCPDEDTTLVEAITTCLEYGNFRARFWPEQIEAWMTLAAVNAARRAEVRLLTTVGTGSTQVTSGQLLGAARDVLTTLDRAVAQMRSRHRISGAFPLRFVAPFWLRDMIRTDLAREMPGSADERLAVADATIETFIRARNVNVTWALDGETGQVYGAQGDGPLNGWASTVVTYLYPEGSWLFLDGGTLDLGIVRDSTLNSTNDVQMFTETFEAAHFHGVESLRLTMDLCPDGTTSGTVDIDPCTVGS